MSAHRERPSRCAFVGSLLMAPGSWHARSALAARAPAGRGVIGWHVTIAPSWADPSTAPPNIMPFGILYAVHDALVRPTRSTEAAGLVARGSRQSRDWFPSPPVTPQDRGRRPLRFGSVASEWRWP